MPRGNPCSLITIGARGGKKLFRAIFFIPPRGFKPSRNGRHKLIPPESWRIRRRSSRRNAELIQLYWDIGRAIVAIQEKQRWGAGVIPRLARDITNALPEVKGLLPILWSNRAGAEVMKPLAAPIIGGMVSSLACILIITPVIFAWLREGEIRR
jgi:hypothetical protein